MQLVDIPFWNSASLQRNCNNTEIVYIQKVLAATGESLYEQGFENNGKFQILIGNSNLFVTESGKRIYKCFDGYYVRPKGAKLDSFILKNLYLQYPTQNNQMHYSVHKRRDVHIDLEHTIYHEFGHYYWKYFMPKNVKAFIKDQWKANRRAVTAYGGKNAQEYWCEAFALVNCSTDIAVPKKIYKFVQEIWTLH